jgi:phosphoglycolate phosphatase-like HAD superfamily hydrolase
MKQSLALDLDGTLVTCEPRQVGLFRAVAARWDISLEGSEFWSLKREGASTRDAAIALGIPANLARRMSDEWIRMAEEPFWLGLDRCFDDTLPELRRIGTLGIERVLLTARTHRWWLLAELKRLRLDRVIDRVIVVNPARASEEKAQALGELEPLGFVGDTESDARAAKSSEVSFAAVDSGQRSRAFLSQHGIAAIAGTLAEALQLFEATRCGT